MQRVSQLRGAQSRTQSSVSLANNLEKPGSPAAEGRGFLPAPLGASGAELAHFHQGHIADVLVVVARADINQAFPGFVRNITPRHNTRKRGMH